MAGDDLPTEYDAIVLGTGMTECIIAAALSRIGQKVLHLDRNDYYSGDWATFNLKGFQEWITVHQNKDEANELKVQEVKLEDLLKDGEKTLLLQIESNSISNVTKHVYISEKTESVPKQNSLEDELTEKSNKDSTLDQHHETGEGDPSEHKITQPDLAEATNDLSEEKIIESTIDKNKDVEKDEQNKLKQWTVELLEKEFRKFNIDLHPRVLYSKGAMVDLLISSDIAKYCEFRTITRVLTYIDGKLDKVPCSRSDVFSSKQVSMIEKRMLMKLLTFCLEYENHSEEYASFEERPFIEFLKSKKLTQNVMHYVQHAIAMATDETLTIEGLKKTHTFLQSLGRYGNTAFLWPLYGSGELPQCFCRMCAVFGGIYCLRRTGAHLITNVDNQCQGIIDTEGMRLNAKVVIAESSYLPSNIPDTDRRSISRAILLTNKSIFEDGTEHISILSLPPPTGCNETITIYELSPTSLACPKDIYMVHLSCRGMISPEEDFKTVLDLLFRQSITESAAENEKPQILWSSFFTQWDTNGAAKMENIPENVFLVDGPDLALDFDDPIQKAKEIFNKICPGEEFLPKAPNPEDIIFDDGGVPSTDGSGFESESKPSDTEERTPSNRDNSDQCEISARNSDVVMETMETNVDNTEETDKLSADMNKLGIDDSSQTPS